MSQFQYKYFSFFIFIIAMLLSCSESDIMEGDKENIVANKSPNILVILADDLGYGDIQSFNTGSEAVTPEMDKLVEGGVRFTNAYVTSSICGPSRAALMTGKYPQRFGFEDNIGPFRQSAETVPGIPLNEKMLPEYLKDAGYATGLIGKWHLGEEDVNMYPNKRGFDEFFGFLGGASGYEIGNNPQRNLLRNGIPVTQEDEYLTDAFGREAVHFIENHKDEKFFLYLSFNAVHTPLKASENYLEKFSGIADEKRRTALAMNYAMDVNIGKVMNKLNELGLKKETLVIFYSDNGGYPGKNYSDNFPFRGGKTEMWEGGIRIPFAIQWEGEIVPNTIFTKPVSALDILPTILSLNTNVGNVFNEFDGVDLLPFIQGEKAEAPHSTLFWRQNKQWAIREGDWKLIKPKGQDEMELYNLSVDKEEQNNIASQNANRVNAMLAKHEQWTTKLMQPQWGWQKGIDGNYKKE
ncbi:MAG: sulfatase [Bacteroidetes bacterium]|nr:MAG: sulfatase [Bacteroidota bacterium]